MILKYLRENKHFETVKVKKNVKFLYQVINTIILKVKIIQKPSKAGKKKAISLSTIHP